MRISPLGLIHGLRGSSCEETISDVYLTCLPTHNTTVCVSAAAAVAWGVAVCVRGEQNIDVIVEETMKAAEIGKRYGYPIASSLIEKRIQAVYKIVKKAKDEKTAMRDIYDYFGGGDGAAESIPVAIGLFALGAGDPKKVNEFCVNIGGDCDTNAAMAGAMAGAYSGVNAVPEAWRNTIVKVNHVDLETYAQKIIDLISEWETAAIPMSADIHSGL
jgi:ADP-ribosylglycohydrolase